MKKYIVASSMCPVIWSMPNWGYARVGGGSQWWSVPLGTTYEQIDWVPPKRKAFSFSSPVGEVIKKYRSIRDRRKVYTVKALGPYVVCDCLGFSYRRNCKHIEQFKNEWRK